MNINDAFHDVREFHLAFNHPAPDQPQMIPLERAAKRAKWIREECDELEEARTLEDQADAFLDVLYFALGGMVELGLHPLRLFKIVHKYNMAKLHLINGKRVAVYHADGKTKKPSDWIPPEPELREEIARQVMQAG